MHTVRETWLNALIERCRPLFEEVDHPLPARVRCSIGFPSGGNRGKALAECWQAAASVDDHHEIFVRPDLAKDDLDLARIVVHELVHAATPGAKHGPGFKKVALKLGFEGKMKHALPGPAVTDRLRDVLAELGPLPHGRLSPLEVKPKQSTRLLKAQCPVCDYTVRVTSKWIDEAGAPICPTCHEQFEVA
jgi:hypothetical protein